MASLLRQLYLSHRSHSSNLYDQMCTDLFAAAHAYCSPSQRTSERKRRLLSLIARNNAHCAAVYNSKQSLFKTSILANAIASTSISSTDITVSK